jgi:DNA primase
VAVSGSIDVQAIKQRIDLADLIGRDVRLKKVATTRGGEWAGACPFCGGRDRFRVQPEKGLWFCRQCSPSGRWQDAIAFVMRRDGVPFAEACRILGASRSELGEALGPFRPILPGPTPRRLEFEGQLSEDQEPTALWRERGTQFVEECEHGLWSAEGEKARAYLAARGLQEETLRLWRVGFNAADRREPPAKWGIGGANVWLARGIVLPWFIDTRLWQLKIRRAQPQGDKYASIRGGHPVLYAADTLAPGSPAVLTEGEFDALLVWQAVNDRTAVVSLGSASRWPTRLAALLLAQASPLLLAYDVDDEGEKGAKRIRQLAPHARRIRPPVGKDVGEFVESGGRVKAWITYELARLALVART